MSRMLERTTSCASESSAADSRVKTFPARGEALDSTARGPVFGGSSAGSSERCSRESSLSKTSRVARGAGCALCGGPCMNSDIQPWPWGFEPATSERRTDALGCSLWPTPTASAARRGKAVRGSNAQGGPSLGEQIGMWPTPDANMGNGGRTRSAEAIEAGRQVSLNHAVKHWPTPTVNDSKNNGGPAQMRRRSVPLNALVSAPRSTPHGSKR
jgi:hypothetical protein